MSQRLALKRRQPQQPPPQHPPPPAIAGAGTGAAPDRALPVIATADQIRATSVCPAGHCTSLACSVIARRVSKTVSHTRHR
jgi:hypothetical protein